MSTRERWIVYPLLFLALGTAIKPKLIDTLQVGNVECEQLLIRGSDNKPRIIARGDAAGGVIQLIDGQGRVVAIPAVATRRAGMFERWFIPSAKAKPD